MSSVICHLHAEISRMTFFVKTAFIAHNWHIREQRRATARSVFNNHMATSSSHILFRYTKCDEKGLFVNTIQSGYDFLSSLLEYSAQQHSCISFTIGSSLQIRTNSGVDATSILLSFESNMEARYCSSLSNKATKQQVLSLTIFTPHFVRYGIRMYEGLACDPCRRARISLGSPTSVVFIAWHGEMRATF